MTKYRVGVIGATGMVGQRFLSLLSEHPWFDVTALYASARSAGKPYSEAVAGRWVFDWPIPERFAGMTVNSVDDLAGIADAVDFVFCAVDMPKDQIRALEEAVAKTETPVVSNNSANRWTDDVPVFVPEVNADHAAVIEAQRRRLGTVRGFVTAKPNCSIQSYVPALSPLRPFGLKQIVACTYQAISGAGKTFARWPEMVDNVIPYIGGEEEKSEREPLKIWGRVENGKIVPAERPVISAQCYRVAASDGHMAAVSVSFDEKPPRDEIIDIWRAYEGEPQKLKLPSAPARFITYFDEPDRPQTRLDRETEKGMGVCVGRLREDNIFDYKFACLSHNTIRGAAGGAILSAELLCAKGYIERK